MKTRRPAIERLLSRVTVSSNGCWEWGGSPRGTMGYSTVGVYVDGVSRMRYGHVVSYEHHKGAIPSGQVVRHECDNPICVNPNHLVLGTHSDNSRDTVERGRQQVGLNFKRCDSVKAKAVKDEYAAGGVSMTELAERHDLSIQMVSHIIRGRRWKSA